MFPYNALGNYVLYDTGSPAPTRLWSRAQGTPCIDRVAAKLGALKKSVEPIVARAVNVGKVIFQIDCRVADRLKYPISTVDELKQQIAAILATYPIKTPTSPITTHRRTLLGGSYKAYKLKTNTFSYPYRLNPAELTDPQKADLQSQLYYVLNAFGIQVGIGNDVIFDYISKWSVNESMYFETLNNAGTEYKGQIKDIYGDCSIWGSNLRALASSALYTSTGSMTFYPVLVLLHVILPSVINGKMQHRIGIVMPIDEQNEITPDSFLVFVPLTNVLTYFTDTLTYCSILLSNGGTQTSMFLKRVRELQPFKNIHFKLLNDVR